MEKRRSLELLSLQFRRKIDKSEEKKCIFNNPGSIIRRLLRALGENELLNLMKVVSHTRNTEIGKFSMLKVVLFS